MSAKRLGHKLEQLITLREGEIDKQQMQLSAKEQVRKRCAAVLQRLDTLNAEIGSSGAHTLASLAHNSADYKLALMNLAQQQRQALAQHEAEIATQRAAMLALARQKQAYGQLKDKAQSELLGEQKRAEQKLTDELAAQVWLRRSE